MLWIHNPLSILKEKRYEIPKNSAKLFENADLLLILARYVDDDDFLDFLAVFSQFFSTKTRDFPIFR